MRHVMTRVRPLAVLARYDCTAGLRVLALSEVGVMVWRSSTLSSYSLATK